MQTLISLIKILLVVPSLLIVAFTTVAVIIAMSSILKKCESIIEKSSFLQHTLPSMIFTIILTYIYKTFMIYILGFDPQYLVPYLTLSVPVGLFMGKNFSILNICCRTTLYTILFLIKPALVVLIPVIAAFLEQKPYIFHVNVQNTIIGEAGYDEVREAIRRQINPLKPLYIEFPSYIRGEGNKYYAGRMLSIIEYERYDMRKEYLTLSSVSPSGREFIKEFLREENHAMYRKVFVDIPSTHTGGLNKTVNLNDLLVALETRSGKTINR